MLATAAKRAPQHCSKSPACFCILPSFFNCFLDKIPRFPLKRRLSRAFGPQGPPKDAPRTSKSVCVRAHLGAQMVVVFRVSDFSANVRASFFIFLGFFARGDYFSTPARLPKGPLGPQNLLGEPPGRPQGTQRHPGDTQEGLRAPQGNPKLAPRAPQVRPKAPQEHPKRSQEHPKSDPRANTRLLPAAPGCSRLLPVAPGCSQLAHKSCSYKMANSAPC